MRTKVLDIIWQGPQNLCGIIAEHIFKPEYKMKYKDADVYVWKRADGISLGHYIFVSSSAGEQTIKHEYGHTIQSKYLGWLYLFVIGLPSIIWAGCGKAYRKKHKVSYYSFYTERWADKLGGVTRND